MPVSRAVLGFRRKEFRESLFVSFDSKPADVFSGRAIAPGDADYDEARTIFGGGFNSHPAVIVRAADAADVVKVVKLARETGLPLAVRSGGHSGAGHSTTEGGIVLDLRDLKSLDIDTERRSAWAGAGLTAGEYPAGVGAHGMATGFGDTGSVGIGGITLGGGIGYLSRKYGLTIDSLLGAEVVTAAGDVVDASDATIPSFSGQFAAAAAISAWSHDSITACILSIRSWVGC